MAFINKIKPKEVYDFKESYCDENKIITHLLANNLKSYLKPTILDVGAGIGDIAFKSLEFKKTILIDVNKISKHDYPCRPSHFRRTGDFFDFNSQEPINTILISHTLQFIDDDIDRLNTHIAAISPENIVLIVNDNDGFMLDIINWVFLNCDDPNPEIQMEGFPTGYNLIKAQPFTATVQCPNFETLAKQVSYLMLIDSDYYSEMLVGFLKKNLTVPSFPINQTIKIFRKK